MDIRFVVVLEVGRVLWFGLEELLLRLVGRANGGLDTRLGMVFFRHVTMYELFIVVHWDSRMVFVLLLNVC